MYMHATNHSIIVAALITSGIKILVLKGFAVGNCSAYKLFDTSMVNN